MASIYYIYIKAIDTFLGANMAKIFTRANNYYWASIVMSLGVLFNLLKQNLLAVGVFLILSALLIAIGFTLSRKSSMKSADK